MEKISRKEAKDKGLKYYFTGKPCRNGGVSIRRVNNYDCLCDNCKKVRVDSGRDWRKTDSGFRSYRQSGRKYYLKNKDFCDQLINNWKETNKDKTRQYARNYRKKDIYRAVYKAYYEENRHEYARRCKEYRQRLKEVTPNWYDSGKAAKLYNLAQQLRDATGEDWEVDHIIPIKAEEVCGLHWHENLQVIPATLNRSKNNKLKYTGYLEWLEEYDRPLYSPVSFE